MAEIKKFKGLKNNTAPERLKPGELSIAQNVEIDDDFRLFSRQGYSLVSSGAFHSLFADGDRAYVMSGYDLKMVDSNNNLTTLARLKATRHNSYVAANGVVYFSNGVDKGRIQNGQVLEWGIKPPLGQPVVAATAGNLPPGRYMYALTFVRSDGLESGTGPAGVFDLEAQGGIYFSSLETSTNPEVTGKILYLSTANGMELYRIAVLGATEVSYAYQNAGSDFGVALDTQFVEPAPAGHIVEIHSGIAYVVDGNVAWYSDPYSFERFRRAENKFLHFPARITLFGSVGDGIYVATEKGTWFLGGHSPDAFQFSSVLSGGAIEGTAVKFDLQDRQSEDEAEVANRTAMMWATPNGIVVGTNTGEVVNLTSAKYGFPAAQRGAGLVRLTRGFLQYVATLQGTGAAPDYYS